MGQLKHHHRAAIARHEATVVTREKICDFCTMRGQVGVVATVDGKTIHGPWANMCESDFEEFGVGLGLGRGQRLIVQEYDPGEQKK